MKCSLHGIGDRLINTLFENQRHQVRLQFKSPSCALSWLMLKNISDIFVVCELSFDNLAMFLLVESVKCVNLSRVSIYDSGYVVKLLLHKGISYCSCITGAKASCTDCLQTIALNRMSTFNYLLIRICFFSVWSCCFYLLFYLNFAGEMFLTLMMMW